MNCMHVQEWTPALSRLLFNVMQASARNHRLIAQPKATESSRHPLMFGSSTKQKPSSSREINNAVAPRMSISTYHASRRCNYPFRFFQCNTSSAKVNLSVMTVGPFLKRLTIRPTTPGTSVLVIRLDCWRSCGDTLDLIVPVIFLFSLLAPGTPSQRVYHGITVASMAQSRHLLLTDSDEDSIPYRSSLALAWEDGFDIEAIATDGIKIIRQLKSAADMLLTLQVLYTPAGSIPRKIKVPPLASQPASQEI